MPVVLSPLGGAGTRFVDDNGNPLNGGKLYTYANGTVTPRTTYTTSEGNVAHTNPIILDSTGKVPGGQMWITTGLNYKFVLTDCVYVPVATWDGLGNADATGVAFTPPVDLGFGETTDTVSEALIDIATNTLANIAVANPTGSIVMYGGAAAPIGWLLCDGSVKAAADYSTLFAAIGAAFNTGGEGAGNFRLPDLRGRAPIGVGTGAGLTARTLGAGGGEENHTLTVAEMPNHNHDFADPGHVHGPLDAGHGTLKAYNGVNADVSTGGDFSFAGGVASSTTGITFNNAGGGLVHNNMQPFIALNFIIRT